MAYSKSQVLIKDLPLIAKGYALGRLHAEAITNRRPVTAGFDGIANRFAHLVMEHCEGRKFSQTAGLAGDLANAWHHFTYVAPIRQSNDAEFMAGATEATVSNGVGDQAPFVGV